MKSLLKGKSIIAILVALVIVVSAIFVLPRAVQTKLVNEDEIIAIVESDNEDNPESTAYLVTDTDVSNILPSTDLATFSGKIEEGVKVLAGSTSDTPTDEITEGLIKTGMVLEYELNGRTFDVSVLGDLNSDGLMNQVELTREIRHILENPDWTIENYLAGDITKDNLINQDDKDAIVNYIVFDELETVTYPKVTMPDVEVINGTLSVEDNENRNRYSTDVDVEIREMEALADKTEYKVRGSIEQEYKEIDRTETYSIKDIDGQNADGVYKITAYTYGVYGNKSKGASKLVIREQPRYIVRYMPGLHGTFEVQEYRGLLAGENIPAFDGEKTAEEGYEFKSWNLPVADKVTSSVDYTAEWKLLEYDIRYHNCEQVPGNPVKYTVESNDITILNPTNRGYEFLGWTESEDGTDYNKHYTIEQGTTGDIDLYANWKLVSGIPYVIETYEMDIAGEYETVT